MHQLLGSAPSERRIQSALHRQQYQVLALQEQSSTEHKTVSLTD
jgi:hypothetical protein